VGAVNFKHEALANVVVKTNESERVLLGFSYFGYGLMVVMSCCSWSADSIGMLGWLPRSQSWESREGGTSGAAAAARNLVFMLKTTIC
jgi:hypothetical protein